MTAPTRLIPSPAPLFKLQSPGPYRAFYSRVTEQWAGLARSNKYNISIDNPRFERFFGLLCENVEFPGKNVKTGSFRISALNEFVAKSYDYSSTNVNLTFLVDRNYKIKRYFDEWMDNIVQTVDRGKFVNYFSDYVSNIKIRPLYKNEMSGPYGIILYEAYPTSIAPITYSNASQDFVRITVGFTFTRWEKANYATPFSAADNDTLLLNEGLLSYLIKDTFIRRPKLVIVMVAKAALTVVRDRVLKNNRGLAKIIRVSDSIPFSPIRNITRRF